MQEREKREEITFLFLMIDYKLEVHLMLMDKFIFPTYDLRCGFSHFAAALSRPSSRSELSKWPPDDRSRNAFRCACCMRVI